MVIHVYSVPALHNDKLVAVDATKKGEWGVIWCA